MGKNLLRKIFAFVVMVMGAVTVFSACSKDPYKKMRLALDKNEITITYDADDNEKNRFSISATVSGVGKKVSKDVEFVVGDNSIVSPIGSDYIRTSGDKTTATFVATPNGGTTYIDVMTLEGSKKQRVVVNVEIPIESMSFDMATLPIERGVKTDITSKFDGVSTQIYNRLSFVPTNTTQNDVVLTVTDMNGEAFGDNEVTIDGNYITVNSETLTSFNLTATSRFNSNITASISCTVLDTIDTEKVTLKEVDDTDLLLTYENGERVYVLNLANASSNANADKQKEVYVDFVDKDEVEKENYVVGYVKSDGIPFGITSDDQNFVIYGGSGKSTGLVYFSLNYKDYEHLFAPKYVTLRVNVSTFPDGIYFSDGQEQIESVKVYQNYGGQVNGATAVLNILSGEMSLNTQTAYLSVEAEGYGTIGGVKLWRYSQGIKYDIDAKTAVRHGEKIYISFDASAIGEVVNRIELVARSTVNDVEGRVTLDLVKGTVRPVFANGSQIKMKEADDALVPNTFVLSTTEQEEMPYLNLGSGDVSLSECSVKLQNNGGIVTCAYDEQQGGFVISVGKLSDGVTDMTVYGTITAPNGVSADFSVLVYANINSDTLAFRIGNKNYSFANSEAELDAYKITMSVNAWFEIKLVKLLDFKTDDGGNVLTEYDPDGRYEVIKTIPSNVVFENISYTGDAVVSVDFSNRLHIASGQNTGTRTIKYVLYSTPYDPSLSDEKNYMYISFEIKVEAILTGFSVSGSTIETEGKTTFSIVADKSILHPDTSGYKTDKLRAIARPSNTVLEYENIDFEVKYENYTFECEEKKVYTLDDVNGYLYIFNVESGKDKRISKFAIFVAINSNVVEMTFSCDDMVGMDSAVVRITLIYTQTLVGINGNEKYSDRTSFEGEIRKAVKVTNIAFDRQEVLFNVNQFGIDASGNVQNSDRAKTSVNYLVTPSTNVTLNGFYLFYKIGDGSVAQASSQNDSYNINDILQVVVGDGYVGLEITKFVDYISSITIYLVPIDMSDADSKVEIDDVVTSLIPATLKVSFRNGTEANPYKIQDAYDLQFVNNQLDAYYVLTNDILISDSTDWTPIGQNAENQFTGNIKGNGYKISGLVLNKVVNIDDASSTGASKNVYITETTSEISIGYAAYYGLFGYIGMAARISDITFENFQVYVEYNGEQFGVSIDEYNTIQNSGNKIYVDVYVGGFAGLNLGTLENVTVVDDTERGYSSLKGNILNTLRMTDDDNIVVNKGIAYQPKNIYLVHSNNVFVGGVVGLNAGIINGGKSNVSMFVRDKQEHPTLKGESTIYAGGVAGVNLSAKLEEDLTVYPSGKISSVEVYSLINATLVDPVFKGMIRNEKSVLGGIAGLNISENGYAFIENSTCQTIIIGQNYIGGAIGQNYGVLNNVEIMPHIYGVDYVGGAVGANINEMFGDVQIQNNNLNKSLFGFGKSGLASAEDSKYRKGFVYHTKVKFVDTVDEISLFNTGIMGRNYVGGLIGYSYDTNAENANLQNVDKLQLASQYDFTSTTSTSYATVAYSSVKSYFTRAFTNVKDDDDEVRFLSQLYLDLTHVGNDSISANAESKYYGDIVVLAPISSDVNSTYIGGLIGYSDGGVSTNGKEITAGTGGNYIHVYYDAVITNTYNVDSETDTAVIGGLIGKANGILFVYNANILGSVENAKCVGGFIGDSSGLLDRLGLEDKKPYSKRDNFYEKSATYNYSGKFNINNSYTTLKTGENYVQNFAYIGERVENKIESGGNDNGQVNTIKYSKNNGGNYSGTGDDKNHYYIERKVNKVTIQEYKDNEVKETSSTRSVEYRKILKHIGNTTDNIAIQNGYKDKVSAPTYVTNNEDGYKEAGIFQSNGSKTYYSLTISTDENDVVTNTWTPSTIVEYVKLYCDDSAIVPNYYKKDDLTYSSDDGIYLYDENGVAKYKKTNYYIMTNSTTYNYYVEQVDDSEIESTSPVEVIVYTCTPAYVEVEPNYVSATLTIYNNGVYNGGSDFYWYNSYIYNGTSNTTIINNIEYTIYEKVERKYKSELASASTYSEYVVGDTIYANIIVDSAGSSNRQIKFYTTTDTTEPNTIDFDDKNMYHLMLDYVVNNTTLSNITSSLGQAVVEFSYNRLTASNSFYVGFETYLYDEDGNVLKENSVDKKVVFTENDAKNATLTTNEETNGTSYSYYPSTWHYTNINYSDLIFKNYSGEGNLAGYKVKYEDSDDVECEITEYERNSTLIQGVGFVNPKEYIADYDIDTYAYSMYEGSGDSGLSSESTEGKYIYHNSEVNGGLPLAFGKYQDAFENTLNLVIDIAPEVLNIGEANNNYRVDNVIKNADGSLQDDTTSRPIAIILDYEEGEDNTYSLIGGDHNVVGVDLLPAFVGYGDLKIVSSNSAIVEVDNIGNNYTLITKGVGCAVVNISSTLNNSLTCDIIVLVKESVSGLNYTYSTPNGINNLADNDSNNYSISILKNNTSIFGVAADNDITLKNFGVEYTINSGSAIINGQTYTAGSKAYVYGVSNSFKVDEEFNISARPFYLYEVTYNGTTYAYRKYVDAFTGNSEVNTESITYTVSPNSFAYNITTPGDIQAGIANQTSFEIQVQSNDEILVPIEMCIGDNKYTIKTSLENGNFVSMYETENEGTTEYKDAIKVDGLNITIVSTTYNSIRHIHTIRFVADIDPDDYNNFTQKTAFELSFKIAGEYIADNIDKTDRFTFTVLPFQVENVRMSHYTKFWYNESSDDEKYETTYKSYKYASNKIIPGYNSLLQVNVTPSYGKFDYVIAEISGADGSIIRQVVESKNSTNNTQGVSAYYDFPYFEQVNNASNKIKVTNKYSYFDDTNRDYDPSLALSDAGKNYFKWDESGTLLFALNLDSKYVGSTVTISVKGYSIESGGDTLQFDKSITLDVVELPRLSVTWDDTSNEFSTGNSTNKTLNIGGSLDINIDTNDAQIEYKTDIGKIYYQNGKYTFSLAENISNIQINKDYAIIFTATKTVDGAKYSTQTTIYVRPVLFLVSGVSFVDNNGESISDSMNVYYNEEKDIKVQINAEYDADLLESESLKAKLTFDGYDSPLKYVEAQLAGLASQVWSSETGYFWKNEINKKDEANSLTTGDYSRRGYIITRTDDCFKIRIASSSVKDNIVVAVHYDYTTSGVQIFALNNTDNQISQYGGMVQKTLSFNVLASSRDENPLPIKSVDDFKNMVAGESYILLNDLVLSKWVPIEALFRSFDGNGYTITITSFGDVSGMTDIGLFSTIGTDDSDLGYYTTIENLYIDICPITEGESGMLYMDETATLEVNIGSTEDVNVGVLAGTNYGVITNVNVTNNASHIRASRKASLAGIASIIVEDFSNYFNSSVEYNTALAGSETINIDSDNMVDTFSIVTSETKESQGLYVGGLVGLNTSAGYITNSSVEKVNVKGMDYVAGFVSRNLGYISSSYFKGGSVISNDKQTKANSATAGFVAKNESGKIQFSYVLGAETADVYNENGTISYTTKETHNINSMSTYIYSDSNSDMLVLNSNSPEYSASDKRTGKIQINLTDYAGYTMYKGGTNKDIANLRALGSAVYTNNYASGFVGENSAYISNCYANILVSGTYGAGFAYENIGEIESSYSMSSIKNNNENYYPFTQSKTDVDKCFYLYVNASDGINEDSLKDSFSKYNDDVATSLYAAAFGDYNTFTSWGFNSDYAQNNKLDDGVWFIPAKSDNVKSTSVGMQKYLRESSYTSLRPELVSANIFTMSLRYYVTGDDGEYSYSNVENWVVAEENRNLDISLGTLNNPLLITTASDFNTNLSPAKDNKENNTSNNSIVRMVHDIEFHEVQTATTFTTDFIGNLEGNGLSINKLRIVADASSIDDKVTYLGLFRSIQTNGTVRNLNINIEEISGSNINFVGVLAGVIYDGKVYNIKISSTYDSVRVEGLNAVGGLAGMIVGDSDIVNITNNISVKANARYQLNIFSPYNPNVQNTQFKMFVPNSDTKDPFEVTSVTTTYSNGKTKAANIAEAIQNISYVGGIAGIIDVTSNPKNSRLDYTDRIRQCYVNESVTLTGDVVGGLAGYVGKDSSLSNSEFVICENTTLNALRVGGAIVGHNEGTLNRVVVKYDNQKQVDANFYNAENNTQNNSSYYNALDNARSDSAYTLNVRSDVFSGNAHYIGGIIGANFGGTLKNSYSRLNVVNINSAYAGGLIGLNVGGELDSVYTTGSVKGYFATGGIIGIQPKILSIDVEENGTTVTYYYLDDQSTAVNNNYNRRYINNISDVLKGLYKIETTSTETTTTVKITTASTTYSNVVGANIWRYSDTSVYRSEYYSTQRDSYIGVFVGFMSDKELIKQNAINSRLAIENTFFKQTYVYNTNSNSLISEIGNMKLKLGIQDSTYQNVVSDNENNLDDSTIFSLNYTVDGITYAVSRMQYYGSLRSLNEIVSRTYSVSDEVSIWRHMTGKAEYNESLFNRAGVKQVSIYFGFDTFNWNGTQINSENNSIVNEVSGVRDVFPEIVNNLKPKIINVKTEDDLRKMSTYLDSTFILQNDIELTLAWIPVGTEDKPFTGELRSVEGQCYSIKNVSIIDGDNDYFGFIRVANGASLHNFKLECTDVLNNDANTGESGISTNSNNDSTSIAGGILVGLADKDEYDENTTIEKVTISLNSGKSVKIFNTQYVGGVVGYGKGLSLSNVTLEKYEEESTVATLSSTTDNAKFFTSMYKGGANINYAFGGLVGKFDEVDIQTLTTTNTLSVETTSSATVSTLSVNNIDFYVNYLNKDTILTLVTTENRKFDENKVYVGGVFGLIVTTPEWEISTSKVNIIASMPDDTTYDLYIGGAVGYSSGVEYAFKLDVDTNITATLKNNSTRNPASIGGVFGGISDSEVTSIVNKNDIANTITLEITNTNNKVYVGGVVGYAASTTFNSAESNTVSTITTTGNSTINAGGFVGFAENSSINNVEKDGTSVKSDGKLVSKIDLITLKDDSSGNKSIFLGGIAGFVSNTNVSTSNVLGNINHTFDKNTAVYSSGNTYEVYIGGAIGCEMDGGTLDQVSADVDIIDNRFEKTDGVFNYGGLVGNADTYTIQNSYAVGKIYSVQHIKYLGDITSDNSNDTYLGGLVGNGNNITFTNCYSAEQFVLPNSEDGLMSYSLSFWENTNKGGIIGHASDTCTSTNVYYVKDFVPFSNGLCGTGVSAEKLRDEFIKRLSEMDKEYWVTSNNFYPLLNSASGKTTNTQGGGQNPIVVTTGSEYITVTKDNKDTYCITSAQTVYIECGNDKWALEDINIDTFGTMVIIGQNRLIQTDKTITNKGTMFGGEIQEDTIDNKGNIIGVKSVGCAVSPQTKYSVNNEGFIYASGVFNMTNENTNTSLVINSIYTYNSAKNTLTYYNNNLFIDDDHKGYISYTDLTKSVTKTDLDAQNVEFFDSSDSSLDLDIDKYWSRVHGVNDGMFVPKWMYKDHYYDDDYSITYGWYASADSSGVTISGTTYTISSAKGLAYIAQQINTNKLTTSVNIILSEDIDLAGKVWTPIGTQNTPFTGTFDGNGHTISNMSVVGSTYNGLFGVVKEAKIQNVLIKDAQVASSGSNDYTAILVGKAIGTLKIEKVAIEDAHICSGNSSVAGMVGYLNACTLTVDHAYVIIAVNTKREVNGGFGFVVNSKTESNVEGTDTITINNVYGANIGVVTASDEYDIVSQGQVLGSQTHPYYISGCGEKTKTNTYVVWEDSKSYSSPMSQSGITEFKSQSDMLSEENLFDEWNTTWTRESTKNYGLPILNFSQEYWIDAGASTSVTASGNTYTINSASQLAWIAYQVNTGTNDFSGKTVKVADDINLAGKIWTPIGIAGHPFKGSFVLDSDKSISNMTCYGAYSTTRDSVNDSTTSYSEGYDPTYGGLFGLVEDSPSMVINGSITNFIVSSVNCGASFIAEYKLSSALAATIKVASIGSNSDDSLKDTVSASDYAGGVVGMITGKDTAKVDVVGNVVKANISAVNAGGVVGSAEYTTIYNSRVSGVSITGTEYTGGIVGKARYSTLFNCNAENFVLTSTDSGSFTGGIVGRAYVTKMSALAVTNMTAKNIKATSFGGIVGSVTSSTIQNVTVKDSNTALSNVTNYGGVVGSMYATNLSEVAVIGDAKIKDDKNYSLSIYVPDTYGFVVGIINGVKDDYESSKYIVDNIYLNIKYNKDLSGLLSYNLYMNYIFGFGTQTPSVDVFSYTMFSMKNIYDEDNQSSSVNYITYGDCTSSSAWKYDENHYILKANGETLCSNYRMQNADNLTAILDNVETVDGHVVITPYKLESVNVSTSDGMKYLAEWWTYRHKLSDNDTTIDISADIEDYSAGSIGNEKFPFVGTLNGNSKTITFSNDITSQGIIGYATKIDASNITLAQSGKTSQGYGISGSDYVGGLVGHIVGNGDTMSLKNIISYIKVSGKDYVGGIIGAVELSSGSTLNMTKCRSLEYVNTDGYVLNGDSLSPVSGANYVGGIIGSVNKNTTDTGKVTIDGKIIITTTKPNRFSKSILQKDVEATGDYVGSVVGYGKNVTIQYYDIRPLKYGDNWQTMVNGSSTVQKYYGGVAGYIVDSKISNTGLDSISVVSVKSNYVGGVTGYATSSTISGVTVKAAQDNNASITGNLYVGGIVGAGNYDYDTSGNPTSTCLKLSSNTIESVNVGGYGSVGGLIGYLTANYNFVSYANTIKIDIKNISGNTVKNSTVKLLEIAKEESSHDYIGGLIGQLHAGSYWAGYSACTMCGARYIESSDIFENLYGNTCMLHIAKAKYLTPTFTTSATNTIEETTIVYTANVDNNEGWFGEYDSLAIGGNNNIGSTTVVKTRALADNNRWANTSYAKSLRFSEVRYMAMGNSAKELASSGDSWYLSTWQSHKTYSGYGISFDYKDVYKNNTWFGPTAGTNNSQNDFENLKDITLSSTSCVYLSTFGNSSSITSYGGSISVPDLTSYDNIYNFFRSARGYNTSVSMPHVGTLYGTANITDNVTTAGSNVKIKSSSSDNDYRVLYDRFTHWAYIAMKDNNGDNCYGALVIEWSYYIDSDQTNPTIYNFINDVQKDFVTKENQRIDVKYTYDIQKGNTNKFNLDWSKASSVSEPLRSLRDLFSRSTASGYSTYKGLINEFVMAVYNKDQSYKSLYCGNDWKTVDEYGSSSSTTHIEAYDIYEDAGAYYLYIETEGGAKYYRYSNDNIYNNSFDPTSEWYYDRYFTGERRIIKQKSKMGKY